MIKNRIIKWAEGFVRMPALGLDISDRSLKYFKFKSVNPLRIDFWGEIEIPEGIISEGEILKEDAFSEVLEKWVSKGGKKIRSSFVVAALPEERSFLRLIQLPAIKRENISNAIRWEIEANIPMAPEDLTYDHEILDPPQASSEHIDVVLTAFPKNVVESYIRSLKNAGLQILALELESQAIIRSLFSEFDSKSAKIVVDIGRQRSSIIIFSAGGIIFTKTLEIGGRVFEEAIAGALGVDMTKAAGIKKMLGMHKKEFEGKLFSTLAQQVGSINDELARIVAYYQSSENTQHLHGASPKIEEILLVGGDCMLLGLDTFIASSLKIPVRIADPFDSLSKEFGCKLSPLAKNQSLAFTTAIGLALRGLM